jgi:hypothetical protein
MAVSLVHQFLAQHAFTDEARGGADAQKELARS